MLECQLNVRVKNSVIGRVHVTEATDKMIPVSRNLDWRPDIVEMKTGGGLKAYEISLVCIHLGECIA